MEDDQIIITAVMNGHINEYAQLVHKYQNLLFTIAQSIVKEEDTACDIVQDSFVKAYQYMKKRPIDNVKSFLCRMATNQSIDFIKHRATAQEKIDCLSYLSNQSAPSAEQDYINTEQNRLLHDKINELSPPYREVITKYYFENQSYAQIAAACGIPVKTVETRLYRAKHQLKKQWKEESV